MCPLCMPLCTLSEFTITMEEIDGNLNAIFKAYKVRLYKSRSTTF